MPVNFYSKIVYQYQDVNKQKYFWSDGKGTWEIFSFVKIIRILAKSDSIFRTLEINQRLATTQEAFTQEKRLNLAW